MPRDLVIKRLVLNGVNVEGPVVLKVLSTEYNAIVQPLTDPVPRKVLHTIARAFGLSLQALYEDPPN